MKLIKTLIYVTGLASITGCGAKMGESFVVGTTGYLAEVNAKGSYGAPMDFHEP